MTDIALADMLLRLTAALGFGILIGMERQWQAFNAELQTNALVSLGSALFVLFGAFSFEGSAGDPRRVAAQVVTGIGFLCGGVILKQGATVTGLNTAATLWSSAAIGCLCAAGMYAVAALGTAAVLAGNLFLRPLGRALGMRSLLRREIGADYLVEIDCDAASEATVRDRLFDLARGRSFRIRTVDTVRDVPGAARVAVALSLRGTDDGDVIAAVEDLARTTGVTATRWTAT